MISGDGGSAASGGRQVAMGSGAAAGGGAAKVAYEAAYSQLLQQDYDGAEAGFSAFLQRYPNDGMAANAQYWLGETYHLRGRFEAAAQAFLQVARSTPTASRRPTAWPSSPCRSTAWETASGVCGAGRAQQAVSQPSGTREELGAGRAAAHRLHVRRCPRRSATMSWTALLGGTLGRFACAGGGRSGGVDSIALMHLVARWRAARPARARPASWLRRSIMGCARNLQRRPRGSARGRRAWAATPHGCLGGAKAEDRRAGGGAESALRRARQPGAGVVGPTPACAIVTAHHMGGSSRDGAHAAGAGQRARWVGGHGPRCGGWWTASWRSCGRCSGFPRHGWLRRWQRPGRAGARIQQ